MAQYIDKDALVAEIERRVNAYQKNFDKADNKIARLSTDGRIAGLKSLLDFIGTLEVKEVDLEKERISKCPCRKVVCTMYTDRMLECNGACSWVVDYPKLKELKTQKGE